LNDFASAETPNDSIDEPSGADEFDFEAHRTAAESEYAGVRGLYEVFANKIHDILVDCFSAKGIQIYSATYRAKDIASFGNKAVKLAADNPQLPR